MASFWNRRPSHPLVIAHRGGGGVAPENTIAAFDRAAALGVDAFELDVRLSRDGIPVVIHDADLRRTCDRAGAVSAFTADELACVDASCRFNGDAGPEKRAPVGIATLAEVLTRYPRLPMIVELKGRNRELARAAADVVRSCGATERVCFGGYSIHTLRAARAHAPDIPTGAAIPEIRLALYASYLSLAAPARRYRALQVPECSGLTRIVSPRFIAAARRADIPVYVWTVNVATDMRRLLAWGVDGLITDYPEVALEVVRAV